MSAAAPPVARRRTQRRALGAVVDQFIVAGTSFVLMILVRRELGRAEFGRYAWLINAMILFTALQTAWVGDSLTVLDRFQRRVRSGLIASLIIFAFIALVFASALGATMIGFGPGMLFGLMVMLWGVEEIGRRLFMARMAFGSLMINDMIYAIGAFAGLAVLWHMHGELTLTLVIGAMAIGAVASIVAARFQLPRQELRWTSPSLLRARQLSSFAAWRSAQLSIRPLAQFAIRSMVIGMVSLGAAGDLEAARLFSQPAMTYISGISSFLLPMYTAEVKNKTRSVPLPIMTAMLVGPVAIYGTIVITFRETIALRVFQDAGAAATGAILGWMAIAVLFAAGQPVANLLVARKQSREVFYVRAADSGLGLLIAFFGIRYISPNAAPWALAAGMVVGTVWLVVIARRTPHTRRNAAGSPPLPPLVPMAHAGEVVR